MRGRELSRVVTQKGQVTIPAEIRRLLKIKAYDRVVFHIEGKRVYLTTEEETIESAYGAVEPLQRPEDFRARRDQAVQEHAEHTLKEMTANNDLS